MKDAYSYPEFCDIAYGWNRKPECDFIEECIKRYSAAKSHSILDIACGTGIHLREFARRGYNAVGIDKSKEMVDFVLRSSAEERLNVQCIRANMASFDLGREFGSAICMLDSFRYLLTDEEVSVHVKSVLSSLEDGGIYFVDLWMPRENKIGEWEDLTWSQNERGISVDARYVQHSETFNPEDMTFEDELIFKVAAPDFCDTITSRAKTRVFLFKDFCRLVENSGFFDFVDKFYNFDFEPKAVYNIKQIRTIMIFRKRR